MTLPRRIFCGRIRRLTAAGLVVALCLLGVCASTVFAQVQAKYLYALSNFGGRLPYDWVRVCVDEERREVYVVNQNLVRIFSSSGMEVFSFGDDLRLGLILDIAVDHRGDVILLSYKDSRTIVTRCNFRGEPIGAFEVSNLPADVELNANRMLYRNGLFYFVSLGTSSVIITDGDGKFKESIEFQPMLDADDRQKDGAEMAGFAVDQHGSIFFTVPVLFKVFKFSPDRTLTSFGRPGSAPGRFGVLGGVTVDSRGYLLVTDKLKSVVMVFSERFDYLTEFGNRGTRPENLFVPGDIVVDGEERVYVTQGRNRGVSVFALGRR